MMHSFRLNWLLVVCLVALSVGTGPAVACSDIAIGDNQDIVISARTMDFNIDLKSDLQIVPRGQKITSVAPDGKQGLSWTSKYGFVGVNALDLDRYCDGLNEKGLSVGTLWLDETQYAEPASDDNALSVQDVGAWVLGNFATVPEVKAALQNVTVWGESSKEISMVPPFHLAIHDAQGNHLVVEFVEGVTKMYDNPAGVLTNSPTFDWHLTDVAYHKANQEDLGLFPEGTASAPRFVQLTELTGSLPKPKSVREAVQFAVYVMGRASSVPGEGNSYVPSGSSYTEWTVVRDHKNLVFYYKTLLNNTCRALDLKTLNFAEGQPVKSLSMEGDGADWFLDMSRAVQ